MFSNYLSSIEGISIYPVIALMIFFSLFIGMIIWLVKIDKNYLSVMEKLPLDFKLENKSGLENENK